MIKLRPRYRLYARKDFNSELMKESDNIRELRSIRTVWREQIRIPSVYPHVYDTVLEKWIEKINK